MPKSSALFVVPDQHYFGCEAEADLVRRLKVDDRATTQRYVASAEELVLDRDGLLPGGFRYTESAFKQVCALTAHGLYPLVLDLSGVRRVAGTLRDDYSFAGAVDLFNAVVRRRFSGRFKSRVRVVRNTDDRLVDGVLGPKYNYLENLLIYTMAKDAVASSTPPVRFHRAVLAGRRFLLRFAHRRPLFEIPSQPPGRDVESFYGGYHFSNSEITGEASVRAAVLLVRQPCGYASLGRSSQGRLAHTGKDFGKKLGAMFQSVLSVSQDAVTLRRKVEALHATSLGLDGTGQEINQRIEQLAALLLQQGIPKTLARRIALLAMNYGSDEPLGPPRPLPIETLKHRTAYDLYAALTREAHTLPLSVCETVEQAAHGLLDGKFKLRTH